MSKILITEERLNKIVRILNEQDTDEYVHVDANTFENMVKLADNNIDGLSKIKKFKGKEIWIDGDLNLSGLPIKSLGSIVGVSGKLNLSSCKNLNNLGKLKVVEGELDISFSRVGDVDGVSYKRIRDYNSALDEKRFRLEYQKKLNSQDELRKSGEYDEIGVDGSVDKAWALLEYVTNTRDYDVDKLTPEKQEEREALENRKRELEELLPTIDNPEEEERINDELYDIDVRLEEDYDNLIDVYDIIPAGGHYHMDTFEVKGLGGYRNAIEFSVGTEREMDDSLVEYYESLLDDVGYEGLRIDLEDFIDVDEVVDYFESFYNDVVRDEPDSYFNEDEFELTDEQEARKTELEEYIQSLDEYIENLNEKQSDLESEIEDADEYSNKWDEIQQMIDESESNKERAQEELDGIEPDTSSPTEDMIDNKVSDLLDDVRQNPVSYLNDFGVNLKDFVKQSDVVDYLVRNGGYGDLNSYDGDYDTVDIANKTYYVMRTS